MPNESAVFGENYAMNTRTRREFLGAIGAIAGGGALVSCGLSVAQAQESKAASGIRFGTQTNAYAIDPKNFDTFLAALEKVRAVGFEGFETGFRNVMGQFASPEDARAKIAGTGLTFFGIHIFLPHEMYDTTTLIAPSSLYEKVAEGGRSLGARNLIVSGAAASDTSQLKAKVAGLNAAGSYCKSLGLGFAYHNEEPESGSKLNELEVLTTQTDPQTVKFLFDVGHLFNVGGDVVAFIGKHHERILGLHLRDYKDHQQVVLGTGDLPLAEIARTLERLHWKGWVETEEERLDGIKHGDEYLRPAFAAMKEAFTQ